MTIATKLKENISSISFGLLTAGAVVSYLAFTNYEPLVLPEPESSVKGIRTVNSDLILPRYPQSNDISQDNKTNAHQLTLSTKDQPEKVTVYYKNILESKGYQASKESRNEGSYTSKFKKNDEQILLYITEYKDNGLTIIGLEYSKK